MLTIIITCIGLLGKQFCSCVGNTVYCISFLHKHCSGPTGTLRGEQRRNFTRATRAMALVPSQFGLVPLKKISALRPQWPWCPACTALVDFAVFSSASSLSIRLWTGASFAEKKCVFLWHISNIKWDDAYITSGRYDSRHEPLRWATTTVWQQSITG